MKPGICRAARKQKGILQKAVGKGQVGKFGIIFAADPPFKADERRNKKHFNKPQSNTT
ncbi:MAG: hypothetical protein OS112_07875 [Methanoregula sp.]|nr:MAG: hypothetical protein OS112_07875 [Methanoregula sp.]